MPRCTPLKPPDPPAPPPLSSRRSSISWSEPPGVHCMVSNEQLMLQCSRAHISHRSRLIHGRRFLKAVNLSVVQDNIQKRAVHVQPTVVFNEAHFAELVHEKADS